MESAIVWGIFVAIYMHSLFVCYTIAIPFSTNGDAQLKRADDYCKNTITIPEGFRFFGQIQTQLFVCTNGIITFGEGVSAVSDSSFPSNEHPIVAPYWGDVDTRYAGTVYYGEASGSRLTQLSDAVNICDFTATWGYVVTWDAVPAYKGYSDRPRNTFQAALVTDGHSSFAIFNYVDLNWIMGELSDSIAQMGFDAGDMINGYEHEYSRTASITLLENETNVGVTGRFIYSVAEIAINEVERNVPSCVDLVALIDSSNDTTSDEYAEMKSLLLQLGSLDIGTGASEYQVSIVSFGKFIGKHWKWNATQTSSPEALTSAIESINRFGDGTSARVREAIKQTPREIINKPGNRPECPNFCMVFVTDYVRLTKGFRSEIKNFQQSCDRVYAINVRNAPNNVMSKIASHEGYSFEMGDFNLNLPCY